MRSITGVLTSAGVTALLVGGGVAIATSISTNDDTIMACVKDRDGAMRYVTSDQCKRGESLISWKDGSEWVLVDAEDTVIEDAFIEGAWSAWVDVSNGSEQLWLPVNQDGFWNFGVEVYWYQSMDCTGDPHISGRGNITGLLNSSPMAFGIDPISEDAEVLLIDTTTERPGDEMNSVLASWGRGPVECISGEDIQSYGGVGRVYRFESLGPPPDDLFVPPLKIVRR
jgi:hypothetical protein